jgi:hypothetical protein
MRLTAMDFSLFRGKYYPLFRPSTRGNPRSLAVLTGSRRLSTIDFLFGYGGAIWFWLILRELRTAAFPRLRERWILLVYAAFALGGVQPLLQARPIVHWEAVLSASFFALGGLYFWLLGMRSSRLALGALVLSGLMLGCSFASKMTTMGYAVGAGLILAWLVIRASKAERGLATFRLFAYGIPCSAILLVILFYNYARFGSPLDFGVNYVLVGIPGLNLTTTLFGVLNSHMLMANLDAYFGSTPQLIPYLPFQVDGPLHASVTGWAREGPFTPPLFVAPLVALAPLAGLALLDRKRRATSAAAFVSVAAFGAGWALCLMMVNTFATARYMEDFLIGACLLGGMGLWWLVDGCTTPR